HGALDVADSEADGEERGWRRVEEIALQLGREAAVVEAETMGPILGAVLGNGGGRTLPFGLGLGRGADDPAGLWAMLVALVGNGATLGDLGMLCGFLKGVAERDQAAVGPMLDEALDHRILGPVFPDLQRAVGIDEAGVERLVRAAQAALVEPRRFSHLPLDGVAPDTVRRLLLAIATISEDGVWAALHTLAQAVYQLPRPIHPQLAYCGQDLLSRIALKHPRGQMEDYDLARVVVACLVGDEARPAAVVLCAELVSACDEYRIHGIDYPSLIRALLATQPSAALDAFLPWGRNYLLLDHEECSLAVVSDDKLLDWAGNDPKGRLPLLAKTAQLFRPDGSPAPLMMELFERAADPAVVLEAMQGNLSLMGGAVNELVAVCESRAIGLRPLLEHGDRLIRAWAAEAIEELKKRAEGWRANLHERDGAFE
ncbi:MAG: hypothetical protein ACM31L_17175, partial [Actinomycetota bacterium]